MLDKFYSHVEQRLRDHPVLSQPIDLSKYDENLEFQSCFQSEFIKQIFQNYSENNNDSSYKDHNQNQVNEYMLEINDYVINQIYKELIAYPKRMSKKQSEF